MAVPRTLRVRAEDADGEWLITIGPDQIDVVEEAGDADCTITGSASDLFTLLWNRRGLAGLEVEGDPAVLDLWRESVRVRWG